MTPLETVREADRAAYLAILTAPAGKRDPLAALAAYGVELARIPLTVAEPPAGEIRLQWWAEVAGGERDVEGRGHPVGAALLDAIEAHGLPREPLAGMAEARAFDLYADPMPDREAFEAYAGATRSVLIQMACRVLDSDAANLSAEAAGHAGVWATAIDRLATLARDRAGGRCFLPADVLLEAWTSPADLVTETFEGGEAVVRAMLAYADTHRTAFHAAARSLPPSLAPAFAAVEARGVTERAIGRMGGEVATRPPPDAPLREQRAVMGTARLFARPPSLLGRLRERFGG